MAKEMPEMPEAYQTPKGRIVAANPPLHRMVVNQKAGYQNYKACELPKLKAVPKAKAKAKPKAETSPLFLEE